MNPGFKPVAVVTGATRGIGRAAAVELGRQGFAVVVTGRTLREGEATAGKHIPGSIEAVVAEIEKAGGQAMGVRLDLLDRVSIDAALNATIGSFGRLDVLFNNGLYQGPGLNEPTLQFSMQNAEDNFLGSVINQIYISRRAVECMRAQGGGRIIFISSLGASSEPNGFAGLLYSSAKAAYERIPAFFHYEHAADGILNFLIEPQFTLTDTLRAQFGNSADEIGAGSVAHGPEATARTVAWLASHPDAARFAGGVRINAPDFFAQNDLDEPRNL